MQLYEVVMNSAYHFNSVSMYAAFLRFYLKFNGTSLKNNTHGIMLPTASTMRAQSNFLVLTLDLGA